MEETVDSAMTNMLKKLGAKYDGKEWRIYIRTGWPPVILTDQEREWNRQGGRPLGETTIEAIQAIDRLWGLSPGGGITQKEIDSAREWTKQNPGRKM